MEGTDSAPACVPAYTSARLYAPMSNASTAKIRTNALNVLDFPFEGIPLWDWGALDGLTAAFPRSFSSTHLECLAARLSWLGWWDSTASRASRPALEMSVPPVIMLMQFGRPFMSVIQMPLFFSHLSSPEPAKTSMGMTLTFRNPASRTFCDSRALAEKT